ncbi:hypothetical protein DICSQDRAFT_184240 [Dichomitus squalens LYAD-421 SS1]|uniref:F-box domain-containing protein n=1 Tax=Dichomitus squalens (strain LYAD-421) TaxID=732165 RepID=R7SL05_DICSQ|nr:uncharacterized protein DICSQDRAFT_184240 [Dichomitus squalens LYAD-421 SS1]EJF55692.1 hypothetical protein DICSQDRAFT_184240 [Dichomitus squalens LYAD-421 SS1]
MMYPPPALPNEILLAVFKLTQPPSYTYDPSILKGPRNPWLTTLKTKKALVLVCKAWSPSATELLYSDIVIRRMGQIPALTSTFRSDRRLSLLVRAICMETCVVLTHCADVVREDFEYILGQCTNLVSFSCHPHPHAYFPDSLDLPHGRLPNGYAAFDPAWILDLTHAGPQDFVVQKLSRLKTLDFTSLSRASLLTLACTLSRSNNLTSLTLGSIDDESPGYSYPITCLPDVTFHALTTLSIHCDCPSFLEYVTTRWSVPRLAYLACVHAEDIPIALLKSHGTNLTYLNLTYSSHRIQYMNANIEFLPRLRDLCPEISHLAMPIPHDARMALDIRSSTLRYLDIETHPVRFVSSYRTMALAPTAHVPQLKKVRFVIVGMLIGLPSLPLIFHPSILPGSDRVFEDITELPGADDSDDSDDHVDWLLRTTGGIETVLSQALVRQHSWAVVDDILYDGSEHSGAEGDPRLPEDDDSDSEGEYVYRSMPSSPEDAETNSSADGSEADMGDSCVENKDWNEAKYEGEGEVTDSDMEREWYEVEPEMPPYPNKVQFVDDALDSSRGQYSREAVLKAFSRSQLGDYLLD